MRLTAERKSFPRNAQRVDVPEGEICPGCHLPTDVMVVVPQGDLETRACRMCIQVGHLADVTNTWAELTGGLQRTARLIAAARLLPCVEELATRDYTKNLLVMSKPNSKGFYQAFSSTEEKRVKSACVALRGHLSSMLDKAHTEAQNLAIASLNVGSGAPLIRDAAKDIALLPIGETVLRLSERRLLVDFVVKRILEKRPEGAFDTRREVHESLPNYICEDFAAREALPPDALSMLLDLGQMTGLLNGNTDMEHALCRGIIALKFPNEKVFDPDPESPWTTFPPPPLTWQEAFEAESDFGFPELIARIMRRGRDVPLPADGLSPQEMQAWSTRRDLVVWHAVIGGRDWRAVLPTLFESRSVNAVMDHLLTRPYSAPRPPPPEPKPPFFDRLVREALAEPEGPRRAACVTALVAVRAGVLTNAVEYEKAAQRAYEELTAPSLFERGRTELRPQWDWHDADIGGEGGYVLSGLLRTFISLAGWQEPAEDLFREKVVTTWEAAVDGRLWTHAVLRTYGRVGGDANRKEFGLFEGLPVVQQVEGDTPRFRHVEECEGTPNEGKTSDE